MWFASRGLRAVRATRALRAAAAPRAFRSLSPLASLPAPPPHPPPSLAFPAFASKPPAGSFAPPPSVEELRKTAEKATGPEGRADQGYVPDVDGMTGRARREAVYKRVYGEELHDVEPKAFMEEGTRENPIPILSTESERLVGSASRGRAASVRGARTGAAVADVLLAPSVPPFPAPRRAQSRSPTTRRFGG